VTLPAYTRPAVAAEQGAVVPFEAWSPQRLAELRAQGRPAFVNFTAAWCVTCQVNEQVALSTQEVAGAFQRTGAVYLKADWTNRDAAIARELEAHGRAGVPLYLYYPAGGAEPRVLPQLLTPGLGVEALESGGSR
jgi:thiol:disulfide interchange protein